MSSYTQFDKLSEEALLLAKQGKKPNKTNQKIKEIQTEMGNLKTTIDETVNDRLLASQQ